MADHHAAEVLRPRTVRHAVDDRVTDPLRPELLRVGRKREKAVDLAVREQPLRLRRGHRGPRDVFARIEADVRHHARDERIGRSSNGVHGDRLALQVANRADALGAEQLETPRLNAGQHDDGLAPVDLRDGRADVLHRDVDVAGGDGLGGFERLAPGDVLHVGESFAAQQLLGHVLWRPTDAGDAGQTDPRRLRRRLGLRQARPGESSDAQRSGPREPASAADRPFSSFRSSLRKRQSVPWARIFCGFDLIIPPSYRRSA